MWPCGWVFHHFQDVREALLGTSFESHVPQRRMHEDVTGLPDRTHSLRIRFRCVIGCAIGLSGVEM